MIIKVVTSPAYITAFGPFETMDEALDHDESLQLPDWVKSYGNIDITITSLEKPS